MLTDKFGRGDVPLVIVVTAPDRYDSPKARAIAVEVIDQLKRSGHVATINSAWTAPPPAASALVSSDKKSGLIVTGIVGPESKQQAYTKELTDAIVGERDGIVVRAGGAAMVNLQVTEQSKRDLVLLEAIVVPLSFLVLIWVFGGLFAAALPVGVGVMAILGSLAVLRTVTFFTEVSIFALNLTRLQGEPRPRREHAEATQVSSIAIFHFPCLSFPGGRWPARLHQACPSPGVLHRRMPDPPA